ncbi:hypothetical protein DFH09DRAFT_1392469 [Mycena vulgaris]|nr:hypothetical protein DFH09DRAFT_1392469 [Mycena vulgaris]
MAGEQNRARRGRYAQKRGSRRQLDSRGGATPGARERETASERTLRAAKESGDGSAYRDAWERIERGSHGRSYAGMCSLIRRRRMHCRGGRRRSGKTGWIRTTDSTEATERAGCSTSATSASAVAAWSVVSARGRDQEESGSARINPGRMMRTPVSLVFVLFTAAATYVVIASASQILLQLRTPRVRNALSIENSPGRAGNPVLFGIGVIEQ